MCQVLNSFFFLCAMLSLESFRIMACICCICLTLCCPTQGIGSPRNSALSGLVIDTCSIDNRVSGRQLMLASGAAKMIGQKV